MLWQAFGRWGGLGGTTGSGGSGNDANFASTVLLLGFEGVDGATTTSDESNANRGAATFQATSQLDTAQAKFGSSSLLLDGNDDRIIFSPSTDFLFTSSDDFTIEAWIRFNSTAGDQCVASWWLTNDLSWGLVKTSANVLSFTYSADGTNAVGVAGSWTPSTGTWYHVAADKASGTLRVYVDGGMIASAGSIPSFHQCSDSFRIGTTGGTAFSENRDFNGWIDELRITKGVARYASDSGYSVPTAAFPRS